jgi:LysR family transcriptional regulator, nitrogen assimilation regulatory protein
MDSYVNIKELVEQGLGYSILPFNSIALHVERGRISAMRIVDPPMITRSVYIAHPIARPMSHAAGAIEELWRATLANLVTIGKWKGSRLA